MSWLIHPWMLFMSVCVTVLLLKGSQSLFLRHTDTGKCIKRGNSVYFQSNLSSFYYATMDNDCLDAKAQFRYLNNGLLQNIDAGGTFASVKLNGSRYNKRLCVYKGVSSNKEAFENSAEHRLRQTAAGSLNFDNVGVCALPSQTFVERSSSCGKANQKFTFGSVTQYNRKMNNVNCSSGQRMAIKKADYGDFSDNSGRFNGGASIDSQCSKMANCQVKSQCGGKESCELTFDKNLLPSQYCRRSGKEIYTEYTCVDTSNVATRIPARSLRLSSSPSHGFIQIKDGSKWKKVKELNWDNTRQKMLCEYLGFSENDGNTIDTRKLVNRKSIAIGDLICYNTQTNIKSCCIYLKRSTSSPETSMPYAKCKICDNPLLHDKEAFPDKIFSGLGSRDYKKARFTNKGWCSSSRSPGVYLWINLQNEYHITWIVTLGDRNQTKWGGSFSFKYSHEETLYRSSTVQINGNENSYRAMTTYVNIYNVRYIKIESTKNTDFCLRIELCGKGQSPAPVTNVNAVPSHSSVRLSWTIPGARISSYITNFIIYLNDGKQHREVPRETYNNVFTIDGLKPYTSYTVRVVSQDGSSLKSSETSKTFSTTEAAPSGPPLNGAITNRGTHWLRLSWRPPEQGLRNGIISGYRVCYTSSDSSPRCSTVEARSSSVTYDLTSLQRSTKYFVTVTARTRAGNGTENLRMSKITNGERVTPVVSSYSTLRLNIKKPAKYIKKVMVIVKMTRYNLGRSEDIKTTQLKPYSAKIRSPYITAYLKTDVLPITFVIGDGRQYYSENAKYVNQPLKPDSNYFVFLRFFESADSFYSTEWSLPVRTFKKPAPVTHLRAMPSYFSARLAWTRPKDRISITHFIIYLDGKERPSISNASHGNQFTLDNLSSNTRYNVGVVAQNRQLQKGQKTSVTFTTKKEDRPGGPPLNVAITYRYKYLLRLSWGPPVKHLQNGKILNYRVCRSTKSADTSPTCINSVVGIPPGYYYLRNLQPSMKYFVTVAAGTIAGYGVKSEEISGITNGEQVNPNVTSYSTLRINIGKPAKYIKYVMVIVRASSNPRKSKYIKTNTLKPYQASNTQDPYVTAYLKTDQLPLTFVIGDGKEYNSDEEQYVNQPLKQNSSYIVFLRFFESEDSFYTTAWSTSVRTMEKPQAPVNLKVTSSGLNKYKISWSQPPIPYQQSIYVKYHVTYGAVRGTTFTLTVSKEQSSVEVDVKSDEKYKIQVRVETGAGKSDNTSTTWWTKPGIRPTSCVRRVLGLD